MCYFYFSSRKKLTWIQSNELCLKRNLTLYSLNFRDQIELLNRITRATGFSDREIYPLGIDYHYRNLSFLSL